MIFHGGQKFRLAGMTVKRAVECFSGKHCCSSIEHCDQCFLLSRNIGKVNPTIIYFHYVKKYFLNQSIQNITYLILKKDALIVTWHIGVRSPSGAYEVFVGLRETIATDLFAVLTSKIFLILS